MGNPSPVSGTRLRILFRTTIICPGSRVNMLAIAWHWYYWNQQNGFWNIHSAHLKIMRPFPPSCLCLVPCKGWQPWEFWGCHLLGWQMGMGRVRGRLDYLLCWLCAVAHKGKFQQPPGWSTFKGEECCGLRFLDISETGCAKVVDATVLGADPKLRWRLSPWWHCHRNCAQLSPHA